MLLGRHPNVTVTPLAHFSQLLDFGVIVLYIVFDRQTFWVEHPHITAQTEKNASTLKGQQARI